MPRCCTPIANEFAPCYASVVVAPNIKEAVGALEQAPLQASVTAWCSTCKAPYLLTGALDMFPCPSAHHAHLIVLSRKLTMSDSQAKNEKEH
jgi:hypothetical protein